MRIALETKNGQVANFHKINMLRCNVPACALSEPYAYWDDLHEFERGRRYRYNQGLLKEAARFRIHVIGLARTRLSILYRSARTASYFNGLNWSKPGLGISRKQAC